MQLTEVLLFDLPATVFIKPNNLKSGERVVVSTPTGLELGVVKNNVDKQNADIVEFVRLATNEDNQKRCENCKFARFLLPEIKEEAKKLGLKMKVGIISTNLDRSKIVVNYTADDRVDFRELLKVLGNKYKSRIEMKQIGNRDEVKTMGAIGICGRVCCCNSFLNDFDKVTIKMAKNQNISLNPTKINGMCGRLLCCLKYEDEYYEELQKRMPRIGHKVTTRDGVGEVSATDILKETVTVTFTDNDATERKIYNLDEIKVGKDGKTR